MVRQTRVHRGLGPEGFGGVGLDSGGESWRGASHRHGPFDARGPAVTFEGPVVRQTRVHMGAWARRIWGRRP